MLDSTVKAMNELTKQMGNASEGIKDLDEQSQKVADLVKSISGIADQTNLLALNAAIEAARAGDQGRGFAVVADEVRQLASRTSSATEEIVNVVVENRKLTENAVQLIEAGQEKAREALEYSTQSGKAMSEIQSGANEVVNAIGQFNKRPQKISDTIRRFSHWLYLFNLYCRAPRLNTPLFCAPNEFILTSLPQ